jgi:hypothetical protein
VRDPQTQEVFFADYGFCHVDGGEFCIVSISICVTLLYVVCGRWVSKKALWVQHHSNRNSKLQRRERRSLFRSCVLHYDACSSPKVHHRLCCSQSIWQVLVQAQKHIDFSVHKCMAAIGNAQFYKPGKSSSSQPETQVKFTLYNSSAGLLSMPITKDPTVS